MSKAWLVIHKQSDNALEDGVGVYDKKGNLIGLSVTIKDLSGEYNYVIPLKPTAGPK